MGKTILIMGKLRPVRWTAIPMEFQENGCSSFCHHWPGFISVIVIEYPAKRWLRKKGFTLPHSSEMVCPCREESQDRM